LINQLTPVPDFTYLNIISNIHLLFDSNEDNVFSNLVLNLNQGDYFGCSFDFFSKKIEFRISKKTPLKCGQFVTFWKHNSAKKSIPYSSSDDVDFFIVLAKSEINEGYFVFPKSVLVKYGVLSQGKTEGKRGFRIYPSWDIPSNRQAILNQKWQLQYFFIV
jgi:hypothetical protein